MKLKRQPKTEPLLAEQLRAAMQSFIRPLRQFDEAPQVEKPVEIKDWVVAYSGGRDSTALLQAAAELADEFPIRAIHVDHGMQANASDVVAHCIAFCKQLSVPLEICKPSQKVENLGQGIEAAARDARYAAFKSQLSADSCLLIAHHSDDQLETFFLRALRGGGVEGLAAMPTQRRLGKGYLLRPLLALSQQDINEYVGAMGLPFIEDPSNADDTFDRNFLRHQVIPQIRQRWPAAAEVVGRNAQQLSEAATALNEYADFLLKTAGADGVRLDLSELEGVSKGTATLVIRRWLKQQNFPTLSSQRLSALVNAARSSASTEQILEQEARMAVHRYRNWLWLVPQVDRVQLEWLAEDHPEQTFSLPYDLGSVQVKTSVSGVTLCFLESASYCALPLAERQQMKALFQEAGIPASVRRCLPLLLVSGRVVADRTYFTIGENSPNPMPSQLRWANIPRWINCWLPS